MQLRLESTLSFEEYVTGRGWEQATLAACPLCPPGSCHFQRLGTYMRKVPAVGFVARYYCPEQHTGRLARRRGGATTALEASQGDGRTMDEAKLQERLSKIEALFAGATTEAERVAAAEARQLGAAITSSPLRR